MALIAQSIWVSPSTPKRSPYFHLSPHSFPSLRVSMASSLKAEPVASTISDTFSSLKRQGKVALVPYITAGDPDLETTGKALKILDSCGCDVIELGVPYSDPLADGPVIQAAAKRALQRGTNFNSIVSMLKEVVPRISCPIALFSYYNPILRLGIEKFVLTIRDAGVHGLLVPDLPLEEIETLRKECIKHEIELVLLTTPTTPTGRMKAICEASEGFVYLVENFSDWIWMRPDLNPDLDSITPDPDPNNIKSEMFGSKSKLKLFMERHRDEIREINSKKRDKN